MLNNNNTEKRVDIDCDSGGDCDCEAAKLLALCISTVASADDLPRLQRLCALYSTAVEGNAAAAAADDDLGSRIVLAAARSGRLNCLLWAACAFQTWDKTTCVSAAAKAGHADCLRLLAARPCPLRGAFASTHWPREAWAKAAGAGQLKCLAALAALTGAREAAELAQDACAQAAEGGHLDCLRFLAEGVDPLRNGLHDFAAAAACTLAARAGQIECLEYLLRDYARQATADAAVAAARGGHVECLRLLHERGCRRDQWAIEWAARMGHVDCMRFMHQAGFPWTKTDTCFVAAARGQLACLAYARSEGECPWDARVPVVAADAGSRSCLEYLRSAGCPWDAPACGRAAARSDHVDCLRFLCDEVTSVDERAALLADAMRIAIAWQSPGCVMLLRNLCGVEVSGGGGDVDEEEEEENEQHLLLMAAAEQEQMAEELV